MIQATLLKHHVKYGFKIYLRQSFFFLLDYITSTEIFQIGDRWKKSYTDAIYLTFNVKKIFFPQISDDTKNKPFCGDVMQNPFFLKSQFFRSAASGEAGNVIEKIKKSPKGKNSC